MNSPLMPKIAAPHGFPLGIQRFLELESRVSDLESTLEDVMALVRENNVALQSLIDAVKQGPN